MAKCARNGGMTGRGRNLCLGGSHSDQRDSREMEGDLEAETPEKEGGLEHIPALRTLVGHRGASEGQQCRVQRPKKTCIASSFDIITVTSPGWGGDFPQSHLQRDMASVYSPVRQRH